MNWPSTMHQKQMRSAADLEEVPHKREREGEKIKTNNVETKNTNNKNPEREKKNGMINHSGGKREGNQECGEAQRWGKIETKTDGDLEEKVALISDGTLQ